MEWRTAGEEVAIATLTRRCRAPRLTRSPRANTTAPVSQRRPSSPFGQSPNLGKTDAAKRRRVGAATHTPHLLGRLSRKQWPEHARNRIDGVVLERQGSLIRFHPRILELAGHYHFAPTPVGIARGNEKPRVERRIRDIRESFFAAREFSSLAALNQQLDDWLERVVQSLFAVESASGRGTTKRRREEWLESTPK